MINPSNAKKPIELRTAATMIVVVWEEASPGGARGTGVGALVAGDRLVDELPPVAEGIAVVVGGESSDTREVGMGANAERRDVLLDMASFKLLTKTVVLEDTEATDQLRTALPATMLKMVIVSVAGSSPCAKNKALTKSSWFARRASTVCWKVKMKRNTWRGAAVGASEVMTDDVDATVDSDVVGGGCVVGITIPEGLAVEVVMFGAAVVTFAGGCAVVEFGADVGVAVDGTAVVVTMGGALVVFVAFVAFVAGGWFVLGCWVVGACELAGGCRVEAFVVLELGNGVGGTAVLGRGVVTGGDGVGARVLVVVGELVEGAGVGGFEVEGAMVVVTSVGAGVGGLAVVFVAPVVGAAVLGVGVLGWGVGGRIVVGIGVGGAVGSGVGGTNVVGNGVGGTRVVGGTGVGGCGVASCVKLNWAASTENWSSGPDGGDMAAIIRLWKVSSSWRVSTTANINWVVEPTGTNDWM
jgi:hypothetical protein